MMWQTWSCVYRYNTANRTSTRDLSLIHRVVDKHTTIVWCRRNTLLYNYLSMLGSKLNHIIKRGHRAASKRTWDPSSITIIQLVDPHDTWIRIKCMELSHEAFQIMGQNRTRNLCNVGNKKDRDPEQRHVVKYDSQNLSVWTRMICPYFMKPMIHRRVVWSHIAQDLNIMKRNSIRWM